LCSTLAYLALLLPPIFSTLLTDLPTQFLHSLPVMLQPFSLSLPQLFLHVHRLSQLVFTPPHFSFHLLNFVKLFSAQQLLIPHPLLSALLLPQAWPLQQSEYAHHSHQLLDFPVSLSLPFIQE
jgi:hypothetical protein